MPVLIAAVIVSFVVGLGLRHRRMSAAAGAILGVVVIVGFVWAVADGKGDDPWWSIPIALAGAVVAVSAERAGAAVRRRIRPAAG